MWLGYPGTSGSSYMDYIITDNVTSPMDYVLDYSEKFAYMPHTQLIGDHPQDYPHLFDRIILSEKMDSTNNVPGNVAILNGLDLLPIIKNNNITIIKLNITSENIDSDTSMPIEVHLKIIELPSMEYIQVFYFIISYCIVF